MNSIKNTTFGQNLMIVRSASSRLLKSTTSAQARGEYQRLGDFTQYMNQLEALEKALMAAKVVRSKIQGIKDARARKEGLKALLGQVDRLFGVEEQKVTEFRQKMNRAKVRAL